MHWRIVQVADGEWRIERGDVFHFAQTPEAAVTLWRALECM